MARYEGSYKDREITEVTVEIEQRETDLGPGLPKFFSLMSMLDGIKLGLHELAPKIVETTSRDPPDSNVNFDALKVEA
ncbi:hypothetical protein BPOR_0191g00050 [Botrytis porri]|uniref:Uncharacterized protein n=1 Tax=Botrytis porri TaxID=87229 RepID=A0A4Z1KU00_9HELO|nr:hypothetical protein BPOR_0191g00050 [Botrytis porri]